MWEIVQGYCIILLEVLCCKIFFDAFLQNENLYKYRRFGFVLMLSIADLLLVLFLGKFFLLKEVIIIIVTSLVMKLYTEKSIKNIIVLSMTYQGILLVTDYLIIGFQSIFFNEKDLSSGYYGILMLIVSKTMLFLIVVLIKSFFSRTKISVLQDKDWLKFIYFPIFTICIIYIMIFKNYYKYQDEYLFMLIAFGLAGMNIVIFYLINDIAEKQKDIQDNRILKMELDNKLKLYKAISESIDKQKMLSHEYHNQIDIIQGLCEFGQIDELKKYLIKINGECFTSINRFETNNVIINTILNEKYQESIENGILFVCKVNDMSSLRVSNQDIALILSNLLNNAIEACKKCTEEKIIKIKIMDFDTKLILSVNNTFGGKIYIKNNMFLTTKTNNNENHGYGLKNVIQTIRKNEGEYVVKTTEKEFFISISIPKRI